MKHRTFWNWSLGAGTSTLMFMATFMPAMAEPVSPSDEPTVSTPIPNQPSSEAKAAPEQGAPTPDSDAPVTFVATEKLLPANIKVSSPVNEVIKLANSGVSEEVMLAFVTNSVHTFNLGAEAIIYLNDIGVPGSVVTAMIQRDEQLKASLATAITLPARPSEPPPIPPDQMVPPQDSSATAPAEAPLTPPDDGSGDMFYDSLAPYGNWVNVEGYGQCWQPTVVVVNGGWQPYFNCGHWVYSDCGWYWLSDYSWGWAPFHYGSWFRHSRLGWCWLPGHVWGPSWVSWRYNNQYCGWAPLPPSAHFVGGVGMTFHGHSTWDRDDFGLRPSHFHFVAWNHFNDRELLPHSVPHNEVPGIYHDSTVVTRISVNGQHVINNGLPVSRVVEATHRPIHTVALRDSAEPARVGAKAERFEAGGQTLAVFRPRPQHLNGASQGQIGSGLGQSAGNRSTSGAAWDRNMTMRQQSSLILRGAQNSASKESAPANSLVVIGRGTSQPWMPEGPGAPAASSTPSAAATWTRSSSARPVDNSVPQRRVADQNQRDDWRGTITSSPVPSWFGTSARSTGVAPAANATARPDVRAYQPEQRSIVADVPRYAPAPTYVPQRSYTAPSWSGVSRPQPVQQSAPQSAPQPSVQPSMSARPAAPAPSAPAPAAAPAPSSGASFNSAGRGGR